MGTFAIIERSARAKHLAIHASTDIKPWYRARVAYPALAAVSAISALAAMPVHAAEGYIGPVYLDSVAVQQKPGSTGHLPGNLEVKVRGGFTPPAGVSCDGQYLATLRETDSDMRLFMLLTAAHLKGRAVRLMLSDDPSLRAFPGRCSLMWVEVLP